MNKKNDYFCHTPECTNEAEMTNEVLAYCRLCFDRERKAFQKAIGFLDSLEKKVITVIKKVTNEESL